VALITLTAGPTSSNRTISNADITRIVEAAKVKFGLAPGATNQQVMDALGPWVFNLIIGIPHDREREAAAKAASDSVVPISLT